jgi:hypothetical protein
MERSHRVNITYFINEIINELMTNLKAARKFPDKKWDRLHLDNVRPYTSHDSVDHIDGHKFVRFLRSPDHHIWLRLAFIVLEFQREGCKVSQNAESRAPSKWYQSFELKVKTKTCSGISELDDEMRTSNYHRQRNISESRTFTYGFLIAVHLLHRDYKDL